MGTPQLAVLDICRLLYTGSRIPATSGAENRDLQGQRRRTIVRSGSEKGQEGEAENYQDKMPEHSVTECRPNVISRAESVCIAAVGYAEIPVPYLSQERMKHSS